MRNQATRNDVQKFEKVGEFVAIFVRHGRWYVNYQHQSRQVRRSLKTRSKKEARRRALIIEKELMVGDHKHPRRAALLQDVVDQYLEHLRAEGRNEKTIRKYEFCFALLLQIAERQKVKRISQLEIAVLDRFRAERAAGDEDRKPASPKTIHNDTVTIRQLVNFARRRGLVMDDPLKGLKIKKPKRTPQPCWQRNEVDRILDESTAPHLQSLLFLAETGARVGEAKWLTWHDLDMDRRLIHIQPKAGWQPKSGDSRVIPMSDRLFEMIKSMPQNGQWVFTARATARHSATKRQISERRLLQYLKRVLKRLGFSGHLHTFRHSFISFAACQGVPERILRKWIGHVDREILDWYFHLADSQSTEAMMRLSDDASRNKSRRSEQEINSKSAQSQHKPKGDKNEDDAK